MLKTIPSPGNLKATSPITKNHYYAMAFNENYYRKKLRRAKSLIRYFKETLFPNLLILFVIYICQIILLLILTDFTNPYLYHASKRPFNLWNHILHIQSQTPSSSKLLRVWDKESPLYDIWNIDILKKTVTFFFPTNSNSVRSHSYILGSLRHRHHKLALNWRKQFFRKREASNN